MKNKTIIFKGQKIKLTGEIMKIGKSKIYRGIRCGTFRPGTPVYISENKLK